MPSSVQPRTLVQVGWWYMLCEGSGMAPPAEADEFDGRAISSALACLFHVLATMVSTSFGREMVLLLLLEV